MLKQAPTPQPAHPRLIGFLFVPRFSMIAFTSAVEPLRLANHIAGENLYEWRLYSQDGGPIRASNDVEITVHGAYADAQRLNAAVVCSGLDVQTFDHREIMAALRRLSSFGSEIGAVCTGTYVLAKAGLLDGYRSTIHWENHAGLIAEFPRLAVSGDLFQIDRKRFTCAGGTAALDMMLAVITRDYGHAIAAQVRTSSSTTASGRRASSSGWTCGHASASPIPSSCPRWPAWNGPSRSRSAATSSPRRSSSRSGSSNACSGST